MQKENTGLRIIAGTTTGLAFSIAVCIGIMWNMNISTLRTDMLKKSAKKAKKAYHQNEANCTEPVRFDYKDYVLKNPEIQKYVLQNNKVK